MFIWDGVHSKRSQFWMVPIRDCVLQDSVRSDKSRSILRLIQHVLSTSSLFFLTFCLQLLSIRLAFHYHVCDVATEWTLANKS